ncbi:silent information regulator 2-like protein [Gracilaria domingensis]|nr:silent information regulator 2-like protein [Gracilaria domingensis]
MAATTPCSRSARTGHASGGRLLHGASCAPADAAAAGRTPRPGGTAAARARRQHRAALGLRPCARRESHWRTPRHSYSPCATSSRSLARAQARQCPLCHADLLLVLGTGLRIAPAARIPGLFDSKVPRVLISPHPLSAGSNVELLGECDHVVTCLRKELGWPHSSDSASAPEANQATYRSETPNRFVFEVQPPAQHSEIQDSARSDKNSGEHSCDGESDSRIDEHSE